jgi:hypothetical protein
LEVTPRQVALLVVLLSITTAWSKDHGLVVLSRTIGQVTVIAEVVLALKRRPLPE